jgi:hypothetical protein
MCEILMRYVQIHNLHNGRFVNFIIKEIATFHPQIEHSVVNHVIG